MPTKYIKRETFDEKEIQEVVKEIESILLRTELDDEALEDTSRADVIFELMNKYSWEVLQQALFGAVLIPNERVVRDDNIITSFCPETAADVSFCLLQCLVGEEKSNVVSGAMGYFLA